MYIVVSYMVFDVVLYLNLHTCVGTRGGALTLIDEFVQLSLLALT
jgi:hypothetical protein